MADIDQKVTEQELQGMREKRISFIDEHFPAIRKEAEYEKALAEISKARFEQFFYRHKLIEMESSAKSPDIPKKDEGGAK